MSSQKLGALCCCSWWELVSLLLTTRLSSTSQWTDSGNFVSTSVEKLILLRILFWIIDSALVKLWARKEHLIVFCQPVLLRLLRLGLRWVLLVLLFILQFLWDHCSLRMNAIFLQFFSTCVILLILNLDDIHSILQWTLSLSFRRAYFWCVCNSFIHSWWLPLSSLVHLLD